MISSIISEEDDLRPNGSQKDFHLVVDRTQIDFNKKNCRLITFKDVSVHHRQKLQEEEGKLVKAMTSSIQANIIGVLNSTLYILEILMQRLTTKSD